MLKLVNIFNGYGDCEVLFGVSLVVGKGQAVSLLGRNGMGKTTTVASIMGLQSRVNSLAGLLSGGEQQMLAIGRALMINPQLLILDEATEGLAPLIRAEIWKVLSQLKADGMSILVIDKNLGEMLPIVDRHYVLEKGQIVWSGSSEALRSNTSVKERYLALGGRTHRPIVAYS
jgi:ABC-type branched-subunit amino acid transport system ATPase component